MVDTIAFVVAIAAGCRGVWSPCGLSMLSTITPIGERGRGHRYATTARWYIVGAIAGGASLGLACAMPAAVLRGGGAVRLVLVAAAALVAVASDARVTRWLLPMHRRQVNERWLDQYRSWVYGAGFGWQIGVGFATYITTGAMHLLALVLVLASPTVAVAAGVVFGLTRGLAVLLTRRVRSAASLHELHRRVQERGPALHLAVVAVEALCATGAAIAVDGRFGAVVALIGAALVDHARRHPSLVCDLDAARRRVAAPR
jgi:hypothetical protein